LFYFPPIASKLSELKIKSKSSKITSFIETGKRAKAIIKDPLRGEKIKIQARLDANGIFLKIIPQKLEPGKFIIDKSDFEKKKKELENKGFLVLSESEFEKRKSEFKEGTKIIIYGEQNYPHPHIEINMQINIEKIFRSIAKIGLAYLCYKYGIDTALLSNFDDIRSYILTGNPIPRQGFLFDEPLYLSMLSIENYHTLLLGTINRKDIVFIINFFGVKWNFVIFLGSYLEKIPPIEESEIIYINPINREVCSFPLIHGALN
jgi:hypothetical protein